MKYRISLSSFNKLDNLDAYISWLDDEIVFKYLESNTKKSTSSDVLKYIEMQKEEGAIFLPVMYNLNNLHIGNLKIYNIIKKDGQKYGEYSRLIGDKTYWRMGLGFELGMLALDYCFNTLGFDFIEAGCLSSNTAAVNSNIKIGFKESKRIQKYMKEKKKTEEVIRFSISKSDYLSKTILSND